MSEFTQFLEASWIIVFFISVIFVFVIVFIELGNQTRRLKNWHRISYYKMLPRVSMTFQHFTRRGELLTNTSYVICKSIQGDMLAYLKLKRGMSDAEIEDLIKSKDTLRNIFHDDHVVEFLYDPANWLEFFKPKDTFVDKILSVFKLIFKEKTPSEDKFYIELAIVIKDFRKTIEAG
ncbi:MAG: hypothetical protein FK734_17020 [Asgard group archaeon]|nr:hypothetical protein [Asgard group archaeon]